MTFSSQWNRLWTRLESSSNDLFFRLRNHIKWSRKGYRETPEDKSDLISAFFPDVADAAIASECLDSLETRYALSAFKARSGRLRFLEGVSYLAWLDELVSSALLPQSDDEPLRWLDVGAKNWAYVDGLYAYLSAQQDDFILTGIELDAYRIYRDGHSRLDYARHYCESLSKAQYLAGDVLQHSDDYHVVSCFLPFVFLEPALAWGLPREAFEADQLMTHLWSLVRPGGLLILMNQGEAEDQEQELLLTHLAIRHPELEIVSHRQLSPGLYPFTHTRYGWVCRKPEGS